MKKYLLYAQRLISVSISLFVTTACFAINDLRVEHHTTRMGLSQSSVMAIFQDKEGFIWLGTEDGLNKFDGYSYEVFRHRSNDPQSLYANFIKCIFEDSRGVLWIGTTRGVNIFDRRLNKFIRAEEFPQYTTNTITEDKDGNIWVGSQNLYIKNKATGKVEEYYPDSKYRDAISEGIVNTIFRDSKDRMWVGTLNGLNLYRSESKSFIKYYHSMNLASLNSSDIRCITEDRQGKIWIGTSEGLNVMLNDSTFRSFTYQPTNQNSILQGRVLALVIDKQNDLWVGTENGGLSILSLPTSNSYDYTVERYTHNPMRNDGLSNNSIQALYQDKQENIWIGTYSGGADQYTPQKKKFDHFYSELNSHKTLNNNQVNVFFEEDSLLWIGTEGGLNVYNKNTHTYKHFTHNLNDQNSIGSNAIWCIYKDTKARIWVGTWGGGLNLYNRREQNFDRFLNDPRNKNSINSTHVFSVLEDNGGNLWVGTMGGGLCLFNEVNKSFTSYTNTNSALTTNYIEAMVKDSLGNFILSNTTDVVVFNPNTRKFTPFMDYQNEGLDTKQLYTTSFLPEKDTLWIGSEIGLLGMSWKGKILLHITEEDGLPNNSIRSLTRDKKGCIWVGTNNGLARIYPNKRIKIYSADDGLQANEFRRRAVLRSKSGLLYFGGVNGYNAFYSDSIRENTQLPKVLLTRFTLNNVDVPIQDGESPINAHISQVDSVTLTYQQSSVGFEFVALNYIATSKNKYAYRLLGFEEDWNFSGSKREVNYTNLDPGAYTFQVKASNNDERWNETPTELYIRIEPPLWKTHWAYFIYFLLVLYALYLFRYYSIIGITEKTELELEHLEHAKKEEINQSKLQFFTNLSHDIRTPLTLIMGPVEDIMAKQEADPATLGQIEIVDRNIKRLVYLINQLLDFRKIDVGNEQLLASENDLVQLIREIYPNFQQAVAPNGIRIDFECELKQLAVWYDQQKMVSVLYNLLSNACKANSSGGDVTIRLRKSVMEATRSGYSRWSNWRSWTRSRKTQDCAEIRIIDTGVGIPKAELETIFERFHQVLHTAKSTSKGTGLGLSIVWNYIGLHKGKIWAESEEGKGSTFILQIPLGNTHLLADEIVHHQREDTVKLPNVNSMLKKSQQPAPNQSELVNNKEANHLILIIEDNIDLQTYIRQQVSADYKTLVADNGVIGLKLAKKHNPDLIISDIMMPKMNGIELTQHLKSDIETSHIPVMILTAKASDEYVLEGIGSGAEVYLTKPFSISLLKAYITTILDSRERIKQKYLQAPVLEPKTITATSADEQLLTQILHIVNTELANTSFGVTELCEQLPVSYRTLVRKIKALTGQTASEFIRTIRLKAAANLLREKKHSIADISFLTGFEDPAYFSRCFHKQYGVSPSQFESGQTPL